MINSNVTLKPGERIDSLDINGYKLIQDTQGFCFGIDAVLLSNYATCKKNAKCLDLCSGTGIIPILMKAHDKSNDFTALEIQKDYAELIKRNVILNDIEDSFKVINGDLKDYKNLLKADTYDCVTVNPPYMTKDCGKQNLSQSKLIARHEIMCNLEDVIKCSSYALKNKGHLYMIHRADRLIDAISLLRTYNLEPKKLRMIHPYVDKDATMFLIDCVKAAKSGCIVEKPLIVYSDVNKYTKEILEIYNLV